MDHQKKLPTARSLKAQFSRNAKQMKIFILWILFFYAYVIVVYNFVFQTFSYTSTMIYLSMIAVMLILLYITQRLKQTEQINVTAHHGYDQVLCLSLGMMLGIGVFLIVRAMPSENIQANSFHLLFLTVIPISIIYVIAFTYLTQRLQYFLLIFVPSALPFLLVHFLYPNQILTFFSSAVSIWLLFIFITAVYSLKLQHRLNLTNLKKPLFSDQNTMVNSNTQNLTSKFNEQTQQSNEVDQALIQDNLRLQEKLEQLMIENQYIHERLENHDINLSFAHEAAGICAWVWDIKKRKLEISPTINETEFHFSNDSNSTVEHIIHLEDQDQYKYHIRQHLRGKSERFELSYRIKKNNDWHWIHDIGKVLSRDPHSHKPLKMVGILRDIQQENKAQDQLKLAANVFDKATEGIFVLDHNLCYVDVNPFFEDLIDNTKQKLLGRQLFDFTIDYHPNKQKTYNKFSQQLLLTGHYSAEIQEVLVTGKKLNFWVNITAITNDQNKVINYLGITTDLTKQKKQEQRLTYLKNYDLLTGLPNRFYFNVRLRHFTHGNIALKHFAIVRLNLDRFRLFNDILSKEAGDELLEHVAKRLKYNCADAQLIAYLNNDDFAIIYNLQNQMMPIEQLVQLVLQAFQQPFQIAGQEQNISVSIGVALYSGHVQEIDSLLSHAELALMDAKRLGGNTICFYNRETATQLDDSILLKYDLQHAIKKQQFIVYYQPQICSKTSTILGFEALVRWQHPQRGLISPEFFIPLAETTSLISEIGQFVIFESCRQLQIWRNAGFDQIHISVNVVAQQIHRGQLLIDLDTAMSMYKIPGEFIKVELTESALLDTCDKVLKLLDEIKQRNISISLDDFGTGYSSLSYLSQYPIDTLKIDRAFITRIGTARDDAIVNAIIAMGKAMGMLLIAEGVETQAQVDYLSDKQCDFLQGFYFSKPLTALESTTYLNQYRLPRPTSS